MSSQFQVYVPIPRVPMINVNTGEVSREWYRFFVALMNRLGGPEGPDISDALLGLGALPVGGAQQDNGVLDAMPLDSCCQTPQRVEDPVFVLAPVSVPPQPADDLVPRVLPVSTPDDLTPPGFSAMGGTVTGSRGGNAALASLLTVLAAQGIIINSTTP